MCEQREHLLDYLYDEASPTGRRDIEQHLESCDECRDELRAFRNVREDLLAWSVPNPPSVWKAFAPAPVVPWHRQVPAWAMAAAASLMFVLGSAGGFAAQRMTDGRAGTAGATVVPAGLSQAPLLDSKAIRSLIREELANNRDLTPQVATVNNTAARGQSLDPQVEARLVSRMEELVNASYMKQVTQLGNYLMVVANEDARQRRGDELTYSRLAAEIDQLKAAVTQLQTKGNQ